MPIAEHGFHLASKADFHDFLLLHFGWPLPKLPETCPCGSAYSVDHGQICKLGRASFIVGTTKLSISSGDA
mgnify:CR=1 FL=1